MVTEYVSTRCYDRHILIPPSHRLHPSSGSLSPENKLAVNWLSIIFIVSTLSFPLLSQTNTMEVGSYTHHWTSYGKAHFAHRTKLVEHDITNPVVGYRSTRYENKTYKSVRSFIGQDSIGQPIMGAGASIGFGDDPLVTKTNTILLQQLGLCAGFYSHNRKPWQRTGMTLPNVRLSDDYGLLPMVGIEANLYLFSIKKTNVKMFNTITPAFSNHTIGLEWGF